MGERVATRSALPHSTATLAPCTRRAVPLATSPELPHGRTSVTGMLMAQAQQNGWALQLSDPPSLKGVRLELLELGTCCARWSLQLAPGAKVRAHERATQRAIASQRLHERV